MPESAEAFSTSMKTVPGERVVTPPGHSRENWNLEVPQFTSFRLAPSFRQLGPNDGKNQSRSLRGYVTARISLLAVDRNN
jgi:hypothetical protein